MAAVLTELGLGHLSESLSNETFETCAVALQKDRPAFLAHLKQLGVTRLADRQKLANSISRLLRTESHMPGASEPPPIETVQRTEAEWRRMLSTEAYRVLREKATEPAHSGEHDSSFPESGHYACRGCGLALYPAAAKFNSRCGWPAFDRSFAGTLAVEVDLGFNGDSRIEILCARCRSHMGHVFHGEGHTPTDERHCVNSVSVEWRDCDPVEGGGRGEEVLRKRAGEAMQHFLRCSCDGQQMSCTA